MSLRKTPGPKLVSKTRGFTLRTVLDLVPTKWRAALLITETVQENPPDVEPDSPNGNGLIASGVEQIRTNERKKTNVNISDPTNRIMVEYRLNNHGQIETRKLSYIKEGTKFPSFDALTTDASQEASGNGFIEQIITTVPNVYGNFDYSVEKPDRVPLRFSALLKITETSSTVAGQPSLPVLGAGELMRREVQVDEQTKRVTVRFRDLSTLPITLVDKDTNKDKLVVTITQIWELDSTTPAVPTGILDVKFEKLGDGTAIETRSSIPAVFPGPVYSKSIENLIPGKFRAQIPTATSDITVPGTANPNPTLAVGEITHEEQQIDAFNIRVKSVNFGGISPPVTFTDQETEERFGGAVLNIVYTLQVQGTLSVETGLLVVKSEVTDLGNGYEIRTTRKSQDTSWAPLAGQDYDKKLNVVLPFTQQVVTPGHGIGAARTEVTPIDQWKEQTKEIDLTAIGAILDAYVLSYESRVNIDMPDKLISVNGILENTVGEGANSETAGTPVFTGSYSISMALRATAQSSANILPDAVIVIRQFWGNNIKCRTLHFFLPSPVDGTDLIDKLNALLTPITVLPWPKFNPEMATLTAVGQRVSLQVIANSQGSAAASTSGSSSTTEGGTGYSRETGLTLKTIRVSSTIHPEISVGGDTSASAGISATATAEATGLGPAETSAESATVNGSITPTTIPATAGDTDWPTAGVFLHKVDAQPYAYGYVQFQCVVVDAADFPSNV